MNTKQTRWQVILALVLALVMALTLAGCSSTPEKKPAANAPAASADDSLT